MPIDMSLTPARRFWWSVAGSAVSVAVFVAWMLVGLGGTRVVTWMDDLGELMAAAIAGMVCLWVGHRSQGRRRRPWFWLGGSALAWAAGQAVWSWYELIRGVTVPFPSLADVGFLAAVPLAVTAILVFPTSSAGSSSRVRMVMDGFIVAGSLLFLSWATTLGAVYRSGDGGLVKQAIGLAYPLGDVVVGAVVLAVLARAERRDRVTLALIGAGLLALAVSDSAFAFLTQNNNFGSGNVVDSGWVVGYLLLASAGLRSMTTSDRSEVRQDNGVSALQVLLPYLPIGLGGLAAVVMAATGRAFDVFLVVEGLAVITVLLGRQLVTLLENVTLTQTLHTTVAELRIREEELAHQAVHDPLTKLANRLLVSDRVEHALGRQRRTDESVAVLFCDLDAFKAVNDRLGHSSGDDLLVAVAERLLACVRPGDTVGRLGGDEFAVLLDGIAAPSDAEDVARRIVDAMRVPFRMSGRELFVHVSVGVAIADPDANARELLRQADLALYVAKGAGRNRHQTFETHMLNGALSQVELHAELTPGLGVG
jgi:diguanylate cyclase (GGDEF)-like protein